MWFPPLLILVLHEIFVRQRHHWLFDAFLLAFLVIVQFYTGVEVLVITLFLAGIGVVVLVITKFHLLDRHAPHAIESMVGAILFVVLALGWPLWFMVSGPRHFLGQQHPGITRW